MASDQNTAKTQNNACANIQAFAGGFYVLTTDELWASSGVNCNIAVIQEFDNSSDCGCE